MHVKEIYSYESYVFITKILIATFKACMMLHTIYSSIKDILYIYNRTG
jgi:hypothetical protein